MPAKEPKRTTAATGRKPTRKTPGVGGATIVTEKPAPSPAPALKPEKKGGLIMPTQDQIRERAFSIFLKRNGGPGDPHSDWLEAERQLIAELNA